MEVLLAAIKENGRPAQQLRAEEEGVVDGALVVADGQQQGPVEVNQVASDDYKHDVFCSVCSLLGLMILCDRCPASYHRQCLGFSKKAVKKLCQSRHSSTNIFLPLRACPKHTC
jgi:hypothetical protein